MRKVAALAVLMFAAAALPMTANAAAKKKEDPAMAAQRDTARLMHDAFDPYNATKPQPAAKKKGHKKMAKKNHKKAA